MGVCQELYAKWAYNFLIKKKNRFINMITIAQINKRFVEEILQLDMTQTEFAKKAGLSQQTVSHYIKGDKMPSLETFANICKIFDFDANYILCLTE